MIPYAYIKDFSTGVNVGANNKVVDVYMKNCCVASISARKHCGENTDVAVVTNIDFPASYRDLLMQNGVQIITFPFDEFCFNSEYNWSLAFYKLCALSKAVNNLKYDYYAYLDTDVYVQASFDNIWNECNYNIQMYDINHGLGNANYYRVLNELKEFDKSLRGGVTHYGGEFYAGNVENTKLFIRECTKVYEQMLSRNFNTSQGDEFISSIVAYRLKDRVKNAGAYVYRYWTGTFRLVSTNYKYNPVIVLHCPAEKNTGIITIFDKYICKGKMPSNSVVHRLLHLTKPSFLTIAKKVAKKILKIKK